MPSAFALLPFLLAFVAPNRLASTRFPGPPSIDDFESSEERSDRVDAASHAVETGLDGVIKIGGDQIERRILQL